MGDPEFAGFGDGGGKTGPFEHPTGDEGVVRVVLDEQNSVEHGLSPLQHAL